MIPEIPVIPRRRNTKSWKSEARKHLAEATFYRTQAEQAAKNHRRRLWLWASIAANAGAVLGWLVGR